MTATTWILFWTAAFAATHMGMASLRTRPRLVAVLGERGYLGVYSLVSFATFVPLVQAWLGDGGLHGGPLLWNLRGSVPIRVAATLVSWLALTLALASLVQPSPASLGGPARTGAYGLTRITRHPLFMNLGIWALAHVVLNGWLNDVLFFGGIFLVGLLGCLHQDARKRVTEGGRLDGFFAETSVLPFAAIATGRGRLEPGELPWTALVAAGLVSAGLYHAHGAMFG